MVSYEEQGVVTVEANSAEEAEKQVLETMEYDGLKNLDFKCNSREYYTHGEIT